MKSEEVAYIKPQQTREGRPGQESSYVLLFLVYVDNDDDGSDYVVYYAQKRRR